MFNWPDVVVQMNKDDEKNMIIYHTISYIYQTHYDISF